MKKKVKKRGPKPGHGGRPAEGRVRVNVTMLPELLARLDVMRGATGRGEFIESLL